MSSVLAVTAAFLLSGTSQAMPPGFVTYTLVFLIPTSTPLSEADRRTHDSAHQEHLKQLRQDGLLLASGPVSGGDQLSEVLIFQDRDADAIVSKMNDDPYVKSGRVRAASMRWMAPAGVAEQKLPAVGASAPQTTYRLILMKPVSGRSMTPDMNRSHLFHMDEMVKSGDLLVAGPILGGTDVAGLYVFKSDAARSMSLVNGDAAVKAGVMTVESYAWSLPANVFPNGFKVPLPK